MNSRTERILSFFALLLFGLSFFPGCGHRNDTPGSAKDTLRGKITISGAFALYPITVKWAEEYQNLHPRVTINVSAGGAGKGMADALTRMVDLGMFSKAVSPEEQAKGAWWVGVCKDAVLPTVNADNPVLPILKTKGMTRQQFYDIFITGSIKTWGEAAGTSDRTEVQAFTRSDACGAADMWAKYLKNNKQEDLLGLGLNGDPGVADAVRKNREGIGFNNLNFVYDMQNRKKYQGLEVIPIDLNENGKIDPEENFYGTLDEVMKAINGGKYPSPPARELFMVSKGKPSSKLVLNFLNWILTDGQKYIMEAGYVQIPDTRIQAELKKVAF
ncbi:MAG: PstS family phosphate ABC transporter substrate-binding protein [bacterium]